MVGAELDTILLERSVELLQEQAGDFEDEGSRLACFLCSATLAICCGFATELLALPDPSLLSGPLEHLRLRDSELPGQFA